MKVNYPVTSIDLVDPETGEIKKVDLQNELSINTDLINSELINQPSSYAWYGILLEQEKKKLGELKLSLSQVEYESDSEVRELMHYNGEKITESVVNKHVHADSKYQKVYKEINTQKYVVGVLEKVLKAFEERMSALITLGANIRTENKSYDTSIKE